MKIDVTHFDLQYHNHLTSDATGHPIARAAKRAAYEFYNEGKGEGVTMPMVAILKSSCDGSTLVVTVGADPQLENDKGEKGHQLFATLPATIRQWSVDNWTNYKDCEPFSFEVEMELLTASHPIVQQMMLAAAEPQGHA